MSPARRPALLRAALLRAAFLSVAAAAACTASTARAPLAAGELRPEACSNVPLPDARCYSLGVIENRTTRTGRVIGLRIVVVPAAGEDRAPDPVFVLAGGPGQAATDFLDDSRLVHGAIAWQRDLVFADQRGTGGSNGLHCRFYGPPAQAQPFFGPFLPLDRVRACRTELERRADLRQYTTAASVEDLEEVRAALGYDRINLIGSSYGTRLAMEYVRRREAKVRAVVLEGAVPVSLRMPEAFGVLAQRALDAVLDECAAAEACARAFPDIHSEARAVFDRLRRSPARAVVIPPSGGPEQEITMTRENAAEAVRYMLYSSYDAGRVPAALHRASRGDYSTIAQYLLRRRAGGGFDGLYLSITCAEDVPFIPPDAGRQDVETFLGDYRLREQRAACEEWPGAAVKPATNPVRADTPVLIFSGELDPVTPPEASAEVARTLPASVHVRVPFGGHAFYGLRGGDCLDRLTHTFIEHAGAAPLDLSCVSRIARPDWIVDQ